MYIYCTYCTEKLERLQQTSETEWPRSKENGKSDKYLKDTLNGL